MRIYDTTSQKEITDESVPRGHYINFDIKTSLRFVARRSGYTPEDAPVNLHVMNPKKSEYLRGLGGKDNQLIPLLPPLCI